MEVISNLDRFHWILEWPWSSLGPHKIKIILIGNFIERLGPQTESAGAGKGTINTIRKVVTQMGVLMEARPGRNAHERGSNYYYIVMEGCLQWPPAPFQG